jgi:hypothetical protein
MYKLLRFPPALLASAALAALTLATPAHAYSPDLGNHWDPAQLDPKGRCGPTAVEFDFHGDVTALLPPPLAEDEVINPFYANSITPSQAGATYNPVTVTYDAGANVTRVTESGSPLPLPIPADFKGPNYFNTFHTGMNLGPTVYSLQGLGIVGAVARRWIWDCNGIHNSQELAWLAVTSAKPIPKKAKPDQVRYAGVYIETKDHTAGKWSLSAYVPPANGKKPEFRVMNASAMAVTVGEMGIVLNLPVSLSQECQANPACEENQLLLDQLDDTYYPVPGMDGSPYTLVKAPAKPIKPGASFRVTAP